MVTHNRKVNMPIEVQINQSLIDRFNSKFKAGDGCWVWTSYKNNRGYGKFGVKNGCYYAHRISWQIKNGAIPKGMSVCHRCDNPPCVNPNHLFLGTMQDNLQDAASKGRTSAGSHRHNAKLTEAKVSEIILLKNQGLKQKDIALQFGVGEATISGVVHRTKWKRI